MECFKKGNISSEKRTLIANVFKKYKVNASVSYLVGDWAISEDGDIININRQCSLYPIYSSQLDEDWLPHLSTKDWFDDNQRETFIEAITIARQQIK